jgi:hypothetical protein
VGEVMRARLLLIGIFGFALATSGCAGYRFQGTSSQVLDEVGIHSLYVAPVVNSTYKPGVDTIVYDQMVKTIMVNHRVRLVERAEQADAVLKGEVTTADYTPAGSTAASALFPSTVLPTLKGSPDMQVATGYSANLTASFVLEAQNPAPGKPKVVWSGSFSRTKPFPANNQLDVFGSTSPLINESQFDRALRDMTESMMADVHEFMLARF